MLKKKFVGALVLAGALGTGGESLAQTTPNSQYVVRYADPAAAAAAVQGSGGERLPTMITQPIASGSAVAGEGCGQGACQNWCDSPARGFLEGDKCFPRFVGPISNPFLAKDPRSLTELRFLFVQNWLPGNGAIGDADLQLYTLQARAAISERLQVFIDKSGFANINTPGGGSQNGWINLAPGLKYTFIRDVDNQFLAAAGVQYEAPTGEANVLQNHGEGVFTVFGTVGKEFCENTHFIGNVGYQFPVDKSENSSFIFTQLHLDHRVNDWFVPLIECNWYHYTQGGNRGIPGTVGEGDGLLNLGTSDVAGNDLVTLAPGFKAILGCHLQAGVAYEFPISNRKDLIDSRLLAELIFRY